MATSNDKHPVSGHTNPDAITGAPGSHPGATAIGSGSGAATGALIGSIGGPIGTVIGAVAGGAVGGWLGHEAGEYNDPSDMAYWRDEYKNRSYFNSGHNYDRDIEPAYSVGTSLGGSTAASPTGSKIKTAFDSVEDKAKEGWEKLRGKSSLSYDQVRPHISDAYDRKYNIATGRAETVVSSR